jgi:hypothetical protein
VYFGWPGLGDQPHDPTVRSFDDLVARVTKAAGPDRTTPTGAGSRAGSGTQRRPTAELERGEGGEVSCWQSRGSGVLTANATVPRGGLGFEGDVADLVADQQRDAAQLVQFGVQSSGALGAIQALHPLVGGGERDPVAAPGG